MLIGLDGLLATESLGWLRCIPLQVVLVAVAIEMSVAQMLKCTSRKCLFAVFTGAECFFPLPALDAA